MNQSIQMNDGRSIPRVGLGVFQAARGETHSAVRDALSLGYRHIDTAQIYGNEADVGAAVKESGLPREEIFVTSKLWNSEQGYDSALRAFDASLSRMGLAYLDLFLLHWPVPGKRLESWRALEELHAAGKIRSIGVSNFMPRHLKELLAHAKISPAINQIEVSPFLQQRDVREACKEHKIVVEAYSPLTKGVRLKHPIVTKIAQRIGRSAAQVLLRWGLQSDLVVLPKSTTRARIKENISLFDFELSSDDMNSLNQLEEGLVTGWDPRGER